MAIYEYHEEVERQQGPPAKQPATREPVAASERVQRELVASK